MPDESWTLFDEQPAMQRVTSVTVSGKPPFVTLNAPLSLSLSPPSVLYVLGAALGSVGWLVG